MSESIAMRMAKATDKDMDGAMKLYQLLNAIEGGNFLPESDEDELWPDFDCCSKADLEKLHEKLMEAFSSGGLMRVLMAAHALLNPNNKLVDPDKDYLDDHPRFEQMQQQRDELLAAAKAFLNADRSEHLVVRLNDAEMAAVERLKAAVAAVEA